MPQVQLADGSVVTFQSGVPGELEALGGPADKAVTKLAEVSEQGGKVLAELIGGVRDALAHAAPDELEVSIGITVGAGGSIVIASAKAEANITIKGVWKRT